MIRLKKTTWLFLLFLLPAIACGGSTDPEAVPTALPTSAPIPTVTPAPDGSDLSSPRDGSGSGLPPTYTPMPTAPPVTPAPVATIGPNPGRQTYTVRAGDTLGEIAEQFDVSLADLITINNIADLDVIEVGQVLIIPD